MRDRLFGAPATWSLSKCQNPGCGLVWLDPMPVEEDTGKAYERYYTHAANPYEDREGPVRRFLRSFYLGANGVAVWAAGIRAKREQLRRMASRIWRRGRRRPTRT